MNTGAQASRGTASYAVLSPWADVDPVPLRGITPRPKDLAGKKIGLFSNGKRAAALTLTAVETRLKEQVPSVETSWYTSTKINTPEILTEGKARFEVWVRGVDAVVLSVAD
ncbi:MAG: hypothetical protein A2V78_04780 [Betaproteobacteria bacterium RBG_16_64_18]|nr:MAG: hypothetical protein A2V78_04780 [Betaproteobacteria bacterium RBG_16_64_18]